MRAVSPENNDATDVHQKPVTPPMFNRSETASTEPRTGPSKLSTDQPWTQTDVIIENYITLHTN